MSDVNSEVKLNGYVCFYNGKRVEVCAATSYAAQLAVAKQLKVPVKRQHMIAVVLAEKDGKQVTHAADF